MEFSVWKYGDIATHFRPNLEINETFHRLSIYIKFASLFLFLPSVRKEEHEDVNKNRSNLTKIRPDV